MLRLLGALLCAALACGLVAQAQSIDGLPSGFVGPQRLPSNLPFVVSNQKWVRGAETISLMQEVPLGARVPGFPMPHMSEPICNATTMTSTEHGPGASSAVTYTHAFRFSNVGGDYVFFYSRSGNNALPSDVQSFFESMCKQWIAQDALSVAATPLPAPTVAPLPSGFKGGTFSPDGGSIALWSASWQRGRERVTITTLKHPEKADPDPHTSPDSMKYRILSRSPVDGCESTQGVIVDYIMTFTPIGLPEPLSRTDMHALYVGGAHPLIATYANQGSHRLPSDVRKYFTSLCSTK